MALLELPRGLRRRAFHGANRVLESLPGVGHKPLRSLLAQVPFHRRLPTFVMIEPTNHCNLACPLCPVGAKVMTRERGFIDIGAYRRLIDELSGFVRHVVMNFAGETLLHPQIGALIGYAQTKGIAITIGTNGTIDKMDEVLESGCDEVLYSLDGMTEETYAQYRRHGNLTAVKTNLVKLTVGKRSRGLARPSIVLQFVVMKHNEHEIPEILRFGREVGVDEISLTPVIVNDFFGAGYDELVLEYLPHESPYRQYTVKRGRVVRHKPLICVWLFQSMILYNGDVTICCFDYDGEATVGNVFRDGGFREVWSSPHYRRARAEIMKREISLCERCDFSYIKPTRFRLDAPTLSKTRT